MILEICLTLSIIVNIALIFGMVNVSAKLETYEDFIRDMQNELTGAISQMRAVDLRGSFEADDEVGIVFKGMLGIVAALEAFSNPEE